MGKTLLLAAGIASLVAAPATAATFVFVPGGNDPAAGETIFASFNDADDDGIVSGSGYQFLTGTSSVGALPAAGDGTRYLAVQQGGSATIDFGTLQSGFSLDVGSLDAFNTLTILFADGTTQSFTGTDLVQTGAADGNQVADRTNGRYRFTAALTEQIAGITLTSAGNAFEVDAVAVTAVPEPATWAMMIAGFGLVGGVARRRRAPARTLA